YVASDTRSVGREANGGILPLGGDLALGLSGVHIPQHALLQMLGDQCLAVGAEVDHGGLARSTVEPTDPAGRSCIPKSDGPIVSHPRESAPVRAQPRLSPEDDRSES